MSLVKLPYEIIHRIFNDLNTSDLLHLVTICKTLNPFAESHLWRSINLLLPHNSSPEDDSADEANLEWSRRRLAAILPGLHKRANHIKIFKCQITNENYSDLAHCLLCIQESLVDLYIQSCPFRQLWSHSSRTNSITLLVDFLVKTKPTFRSIRTLRLPLEHHYESLLILLLEASPNLACLLINRAAQARWGPDPLPVLPELHHLAQFKLDVLDRDHMPFVSHILRTSPKLTTVSFKQAFGVFGSTTWWVGLKDQLASMSRLHTLEIDKRLVREFNQGGFENLRYLKLRPEYRNCFSELFSTIEIPPLPVLEILELHPGRARTTSKSLGISKCFPCTLASTSPGVVDLYRPIPIPVSTLRQLDRAPCLRRIILTTSLTTTDPSTGEIELKNFHEDIVVRRWHLARGVFTWIKSWSHVVKTASEEVIHLDHEVQQDWVDLGSKYLTDEQLENVCRLAGIDRGWVTPGVNTTLAQQGLEYLDSLFRQE